MNNLIIFFNFLRSIKLKFTIAILILGLQNVQAKAGFEYKYKDRQIVDVTALVGIEEAQAQPGDGCEHRISDLVVDEVVYKGTSELVEGFRAKKPAPVEWYGLFRIDSDALYKSISNAEHGNVPKLIKKGAKLIVVYQVCGNGGFVYVRDIFKKSAINNP